MALQNIDLKNLDMDFYRAGEMLNGEPEIVYNYDYVEKLRKENLELKKKGKRSYNILPQAGFQEDVATNEADIKIIGGVRGCGKTAIALICALPYSMNPDVNMYGFRRLENDVKRGIWKSCKPIFRGFANFADTSFEVKFFNGTGATMKMEHLADLKQVKDRFRGAEMPYIVIEELAEFTKNDLNVIFDLIPSNRSTAGVAPQFICTCNPVGKSNKLRLFLDWWIDTDNDMAIPARSGKIRYFCRYGEDVMEIAWGDTPEEVYGNPNARNKICSLTDDPDRHYKEFITSVSFIDGDYGDNKILHVTDPKYMNRISAGGSKSTINDIRGIWRDVDDSGSLLTMDDMQRFFGNTPQVSGVRVGGGDIALKDDWFVLWAMDGWHIIDVDAARWLSTENAIRRTQDFIKRNNIPFENFTFDADGIGKLMERSEEMQKCPPFNNKAPAENRIYFNRRKDECAGILIEKIQGGEISIDEAVLRRSFSQNKIPFTIEERLLQERIALKWGTLENPKALIKKKEMIAILGHSPDFLEALLYAIDRADAAKKKQKVRRGNWGWFGK